MLPRLLVQLDQLALERCRHCFGARGNPQLGVNICQVILYGTVANCQIGANLLVGQTVGGAPQHIQFTLGQRIAARGRLSQPRNQARRDGWVDRRLAGRRRAHGAHDLTALGGLEDVAACAGIEQPVDVRVVVVGS